MDDNPKKIIYILSLGHSGSTLLDLLLSYHDKVIGLGEVYSVIGDKDSNLEQTEDICSCGKQMSKCPVWSYSINKEGAEAGKNLIWKWLTQPRKK